MPPTVTDFLILPRARDPSQRLLPLAPGFFLLSLASDGRPSFLTSLFEVLQWLFLATSVAWQMTCHPFSQALILYILLFISETMERKLVEETKQLELDLNDERLRYQNLLNEFSRLEERYDDLKEEMTLMLVSPALPSFKESFCVTQGSLRLTILLFFTFRGLQAWSIIPGFCIFLKMRIFSHI